MRSLFDLIPASQMKNNQLDKLYVDQSGYVINFNEHIICYIYITYSTRLSNFWPRDAYSCRLNIGPASNLLITWSNSAFGPYSESGSKIGPSHWSQSKALLMKDFNILQAVLLLKSQAWIHVFWLNFWFRNFRTFVFWKILNLIFLWEKFLVVPKLVLLTMI